MKIIVLFILLVSLLSISTLASEISSQIDGDTIKVLKFSLCIDEKDFENKEFSEELKIIDGNNKENYLSICSYSFDKEKCLECANSVIQDIKQEEEIQNENFFLKIVLTLAIILIPILFLVAFKVKRWNTKKIVQQKILFIFLIILIIILIFFIILLSVSLLSVH